jgi:endonuclease/exonuclease/phosphatase family metal-dependent hydrolase
MGVQIHVMTFNLATGVDPGTCSWVDRRLALHVDEINERQPDIACFQEVDRWTGRSQGVDQVEILKTRTHLKYDVFTGVSYDGGYFGDAILSRWRPTAFNNKFIVDSSLPFPVPGYGHNVDHIPIPMATFRIYGIPVRIRSIHYPLDGTREFGWDSPNTWHHQKAAMGGLLLTSWPFQLDTIIGGDFNAGLESPSMAPLMQHYRETSQEVHDTFNPDENDRCRCLGPGLDPMPLG